MSWKNVRKKSNYLGISILASRTYKSIVVCPWQRTGRTGRWLVTAADTQMQPQARRGASSPHGPRRCPQRPTEIGSERGVAVSTFAVSLLRDPRAVLSHLHCSHVTYFLSAFVIGARTGQPSFTPTHTARLPPCFRPPRPGTGTSVSPAAFALSRPSRWCEKKMKQSDYCQNEELRTCTSVSECPLQNFSFAFILLIHMWLSLCDAK